MSFAAASVTPNSVQSHRHNRNTGAPFSLDDGTQARGAVGRRLFPQQRLQRVHDLRRESVVRTRFCRHLLDRGQPHRRLMPAVRRPLAWIPRSACVALPLQLKALVILSHRVCQSSATALRAYSHSFRGKVPRSSSSKSRALQPRLVGPSASIASATLTRCSTAAGSQ